MKALRYFSSESVTEGHPDKVCDLIADSILDAALTADANSRIACEVCCTTGLVMVMGEFTIEKGYIDIPKIVRKVVKDIGYDDAKYGFDGNTCAVLTSIDEQSGDIDQGVSNALEARENGQNDRASKLGAGDQGMMFGYACTETNELMPLPIMLAHALTKGLTDARKSGALPYLRPDGKAQVTVAYLDQKPVYIDTIVLSAQHEPGIAQEDMRKDLLEAVIHKVIDPAYLTVQTKYLINPSGNFVIGGPLGDTGVTGRKIIVDTYGGVCPHGGGSFSGKDPTKVDRSACYYARYVCKNVVAAKLCERCEIQVAYAIGKANPVSIFVNTFGTSVYTDQQIIAAIEQVFDFRPYSIIEKLKLRQPLYASTTNYGHFGKSGLPWEQTDKAEALKQAIRK